MTDQTNPNPSLRSSASASSSPNFPTDPEQQLQAGNANAPQRIRRRNRLITSCLECRRRKLKCDKQSPCSNCTRFKRDCVFLAPALDPASQMKLTEIKEKMGSLERTLEQDVARKGSRSAAGSRYGLTGEPLAGLENAEDSEDDFHVPDEERDLEPTALATEDATYYEDADDELMDLGVRLGKMRITERIGGFVRPKLSEELVQMLRGLASRGVTPTSPPGVNFLDHGPDYIAPASSFLFGGTPEARRTSVVEYLPSRTASDKLILQYWEAVHPIIRIVHRPSFERHYAAFWAALSRGVEPPASFQALVLSTMLAAVMSMTEDAAVMEFGVAKIELIESFQKGTETALARANVLRTTKLETLQALISYLIPLCRGEVSRAHSALTGMAIRLAECMGLHRDGSNYGLSPIEIHVRRLCWYQLCYLDVRTCEATGPRPQIHREDFDTKYPLNVNDADLESPYPPKSDSENWTDNTIARMRFEINEAHRLMWSERPRLETKQTTLTSLLSKIKSINNALEERYIPMFENGKTPLQAEAYHIFRVLTTRMYIMTLQRYTSSRNRKMPERLRSLIFGASCTSLEHAMVLETAPALQQWLWYAGAFQQWHSALLILSEWFAAPNLPDFEERIWRCIDFAFETPADLDRPSKAYLIISELRNRLNAYRDARKYRAPTNIERLMQSSQQSQDLGFSEQQINAPMAPSRMMGAVPEGDFNYSGMAVAEASTSTHPALTYSPPNIPVPYTRESSAGASDKSPSDFSDVNLDIDWNEWDRLFPPEFNASSLNFSEMDYGNSQFTQGL